MCKYCENKETYEEEDYTPDGELFINYIRFCSNNQAIIGREWDNRTKGFTFIFNINYCPICGRKLEDTENV